MHRQRLTAEDWAIRIGIALLAVFFVLLLTAAARGDDAPAIPGPVLFVYLNEGSNNLGAGGATTQRDALVAMLDPVIRYGFKTIALRSYPGCVRDDYYAPLLAKCKPAGVAVIGSGYDLSVFTAFYGSSDSDEWWRLSDRPGDKNKARAPPATQPSKKLTDRDHWAIWQASLLDGRLIDSMRDAAIKVAAVTGTKAAVFDLEYVFYSTKQSGFWTDANISAVAANFARMVVSLKEAGIRPLLYHPTPGMDAAYDRIALNILARLAVQEIADWPVHLSPHNYYVPAKIASWGTPPTLPQVDAMYRLGAGPQPTVFYGFASNRQLSQGWSASEFDTLIRTAGIADRCWLFIGAPKSQVAADFAVLPPLK